MMEGGVYPYSTLYNTIQSKSLANFLSGTVQAAGSLSGSSTSAIPTYSTGYQRIIALVMGAVTLVITSPFQHTTNTNGNWERLGRTNGMTFYLFFFFCFTKLSAN